MWHASNAGARGRGALSGMSSSSSAAEIVFDHVTKRYGNAPNPAIDDLSLTLPAGEICVLIGPSGGGKTTAMKMVNRLISISEGDITIDGTSVNALDVTELRRGIGYVIQQVGLFPHLDIEAKVATVPRLLGWDKQRTRERGRELLELVGLDPDEHGKRYPAQLSGGPRHRARVPRGGARRGGPPPAAAAGRPAADADGRAVRRDRPDHARAAAERLPAPARGDPQDRRVRHARHRRGDQDGPPRRDPARGRQARAVRHPGGDSRASGRRVRGPL